MNDMLIIIGASGHGKVLADIAIKMQKWKKISFLDDDPNIREILGCPVIGPSSDASHYKEQADFIVGIGDNEIRANIQKDLMEAGFSVTTLIHPSAIIATEVEIGIGTVIMARVVINSSTRIGNGVIINTSASVDHDNVIEDFVHLSPGVRIAGTVKVGKQSWLGIGSTIINNIVISEKTIIGAGAVVVKDIPENCTAVGSPAKPIKFH